MTRKQKTLKVIERKSERTNQTRFGLSHDKYHTTIEITEGSNGQAYVSFDVLRNGINIRNGSDTLRPSMIKYLNIEAEVAELGLS